MNIALCKCGVDMSEHPHMDPWEDYPLVPIPPEEHYFEASGTRHRCDEEVPRIDGTWLCPRPKYHEEHGVECGPLTGKKLW